MSYRCLFVDDDDLLLASCAQDCFVRVWRISSKSVQQAVPLPDQDELKLKDKTFSVSHQGSNGLRCSNAAVFSRRMSELR